MTETISSKTQMLQGIFPFSNLDQKSLARIVPFVEKASFSSGVQLFLQEDEADALFFIIVGSVEITREDKHGKRILAYLGTGDHFGEDCLTGFHRCQTNAVTTSRTILLRILRKNIQAVSDLSPTMQRIFILMRRSYLLQIKLMFPWHEVSETLYLITRRHPIFVWLRVVPLGLITLAGFAGLLSLALKGGAGGALWLVTAILLLMIGGLITGWAAMEWANDYFILTRDRVLMQRLVVGFYDSRAETPMSAILSTGMDATFFGRVFGFGAVTARAYTGDLRLKQLPDPDLVQAYLEHRRRSLQTEQRREEQAAMHSMLQNRLQPGQTRATQPIPTRTVQDVRINYYTGSFFDWIAKLFGLRTEKEGAIIYRTHWWILVKKTFIPALFLLLDLGIVIAAFIGAVKIDVSLVYALAIIAAIIGFGSWMYSYFDWRNDIYVISGDQLEDVNRRPLGSEEKRTAPVKHIQTVEYKRNGIISLVLNFGTVRIQIGNEELTFDNVYKPSVVQIEIFNHLRQFNEQSRKLEQKRMVDWISTYDTIRRDDDSEKKSGNPGKNG